jgi:NitT/TauT family transport system ATP-binding protein
MDAIVPAASPLLQAVSVSFGYPEVRGHPEPILEAISFEGQRRDTIAIMGRSGVGKTTLCRILAGLVVPQSGSVYFGGERLRGPTTQITISFQDSPCFPWMTVAENVAFAKADRSSAFVDQLISDLGLDRERSKYPKDLSGGMRQRVAIGRALAVRPSCLILDEPFSALDILTKRQLQDVLRSQQNTRDLLIITVLHSLEDALAVANRLLILGSRPARILADIPVNPDAEFRALRDRITDVLSQCD